MEKLIVSGIVVHGEKRGRTLGFPTANIQLNTRQANIMPPIGIYAVWVTGKPFSTAVQGAASWGFNPTFGLPNPQLEVHILNFDGNLYDQELSVEFVEYIRGEERFENLEELKRAVTNDCEKAIQILKANL